MTSVSNSGSSGSAPSSASASPSKKGPRPAWGYLAQYESTAAIYKAAEKVRAAGYTVWDCCTPFAVHGLDKAMGVKPSKLPWYVLGVGIFGSIFGLVFQIWAMRWATPVMLAGKTFWSIPAYVPVWYETTILSCCLTIFFGNWFLNRLPQLHHPTFSSKAFERVTDDKFFVVIEASDPLFDKEKTRALLQETGASLIEEVQDT